MNIRKSISFTQDKYDSTPKSGSTGSSILSENYK